MAAAVTAPTPTFQLPATWLKPSPEYEQEIGAALASALTFANEYRASHTSSELWMLPASAMNNGGWPPNAEVEKSELGALHELEKLRTPEMDAVAQWLAKNCMNNVWEWYLEEYRKRVGPAQAAFATKLLHDTLDISNQATQIHKASAGRKRPYVVDPTLTTAVDKPGGSPSFPSGHTSSAYAGAVVMAYLMPDKADEIMHVALQSGFARMYAGVHFPSDTIAGAKLGAMIAYVMVQRAARAQAAKPKAA